MVKELIQYYCEKCGTPYPTKEETEYCENLPILHTFGKRELYKCGFFIENDIIFAPDFFKKINYEKLKFDINKISEKRKTIFKNILKKIMTENKKCLIQNNIDLNKNCFEKIINDLKKNQRYEIYKNSQYYKEEKDKLLSEIIQTELRVNNDTIFSLIPTKIGHPRSLGEVYITFTPFKNHKSLEKKIPGYFSYILKHEEKIRGYHTQTYLPTFIFTSNIPIKDYNKDILLFSPYSYEKNDYHTIRKNENNSISCPNIKNSISYEKENAPWKNNLKDLLNVPAKEILLERIDSTSMGYKIIAGFLEKIRLWSKEDY